MRRSTVRKFGIIHKVRLSLVDIRNIGGSIMIIRSLENIDMQEFTTCFNEAFSDYVIPFHASAEYLSSRFNGAGVNDQLSFGAFGRDNKLVAFIMHGIHEKQGEKIAFNVGTGVIPEYRGRRLVGEIYHQAIPSLKADNVKQVMLEVIQMNEKAIKAYRNIGFEIKRELICFKGSIEIKDHSFRENIEIRTTTTDQFDWDSVTNLWNYEPSWEQSIHAILRNPHLYEVYLIGEEDHLHGYAVVNSTTGSILQFGVREEFREQGIGATLFRKIGEKHSKVSILNIDKRDTKTIHFLKRRGLDVMIEQYEMAMELK